MKKLTKAIFFDRDGTIILEKGYIDNVEKIELIPGATEVLFEIMNLGFKIVIISNQSGVARGYFPESRVTEINSELENILKSEKVTVDGVYYCPHHIDGSIPEYKIECKCRKPGTGMIEAAVKDLNIRIDGSFLVGDKLSDVECGFNAGLKSILVRTGYGYEEEAKIDKNHSNKIPDFIADTLNDVLEILRNEMDQ
ncbi:D-glycero-alpha-D-manno-heptose-1,7-bisphosphate 7-phosphatase [candidate division KSB1 bacterium]